MYQSSICLTVVKIAFIVAHHITSQVKVKKDLTTPMAFSPVRMVLAEIQNGGRFPNSNVPLKEAAGTYVTRV